MARLNLANPITLHERESANGRSALDAEKSTRDERRNAAAAERKQNNVSKKANLEEGDWQSGEEVSSEVPAKTWMKPITSETSTRSPTKQIRSPRKGKAGGNFEIFSECNDESESERDETEARPLRPTKVNALFFPPLQRGRQDNRSQKGRSEDFDKENHREREETDDEKEEDTRRNSNRSLRQQTTRRTAAQETSRSNNNRSGKQFSKYRQPPPEIEETDEEEEEEESEDGGYDSLDDFIVSDNAELSYYDTSDGLHDDDDDDDDDEIEAPPPQPQPRRRRLIRGRRPRTPEPERKEEEELEEDNTDSKEQLRLEPSLPKALHLSSHKLGSTKLTSLFQTQQRSPRKMEHSDDNDDLSQHNSSSELDSPTKKVTQETALETPPASPSRTRLQSPSKEKHRIPPSPHRESIDEFWSQELINDWNDQYSPRKEIATPGRAMQRLLRALGETDENSTESSSFATPSSPGKKDPKTPSKTALKKAEAEKKRALLAKKKEFDSRKASFAEEFLKTLDDAVTGGQVQKLAEETGGVKIIWSKTLQTTAGRAKWKREKLSSSSDESSSSMKIKHHATIELAERIIDSEDRLLNTLAHEYCHLANYMISNIRNNPHGASFKEWAAKCSRALKDHPVYGGRIEVTTRHSYKIDYKYVWCCVDCGQEYGRHSKSINTAKSRCGLCRGVLQQIKPKPRNVSPRKADNNNNKGPVGQKVEEVMKGIGEVSLHG